MRDINTANITSNLSSIPHLLSKHIAFSFLSTVVALAFSTAIVVYLKTLAPMGLLLEGTSKFIGESFNTGAKTKGKWSIEDVPDMSGKVILVTGGNTGIGFEIAKGLLAKGASVYIGARNRAKAEKAIEELVSITRCNKDNVHLLLLDLADLPTIQRAALEFLSKESRLDILFNNGGIHVGSVDSLSAQGYDLTFATNVLGPYYLTKLLLPILSRTSISSIPSSTAQPEPTRIIDISSDGHLLNSNTGGDPIDYDTLLPGENRKRLHITQLYYQSKSGNLLVSQHRARTLEKMGIVDTATNSRNTSATVVSICVHPGHIQTSLTKELPFVDKTVARWMANPVTQGGIAPLYAGTIPEAAKLNGKYLVPYTRERQPRSDHINNINAQNKLVAWLEEQLRIHQLA